MATIGQSNQVSSSMRFIEPWDQGIKGNPFIRMAPLPGLDPINFKWIDTPVVISNARPTLRHFTLDKHGFAYLDDPEGLSPQLLQTLQNGNQDEVKAAYYPKVETLVKKATGAQRIIIFDHTFRRRNPARNKTENRDGREQPATMVHCDQSVKGALNRLRQNLDPNDDYDSIVKKRVQMINVWKPLNGPVVDWPLAQMDYTTLNLGHVHPVDLLRGNNEHRGQTVAIAHHPDQKWWYLDHHRSDEVTMIKIWDSWGDRGVADMCAHAAFEHPDTPEDAAPRESIEVRCLALHDV
ncbi:hypothetical protein F5Y16DRAFT_387102 [Xylariaceae sp. FL0255]|nr:hypothetical protein F5Y16DRAFT_387102 [Xylariaceae sp. FL0255]